MNKIYKSKIGIELILILAVTFGSIGVVIVKSGDYESLLLNVIILSAIGYIFWKTEYTISNKNLNVKCSFFYNTDIEIATIRSIKEIYNPMSAPAASIDRLEIRYNNSDSILISPKEKMEFINHLKRINPTIQVDFRVDKY
ncbi:PH domain-containing protein [Flavobacterium sp. SM2513]|uniref:PH domain-containing protein n=1 Tax=Flavobacterium sp. SM2513 TaxID=3424766 RepID=UPI003D7FA387